MTSCSGVRMGDIGQAVRERERERERDNALGALFDDRRRLIAIDDVAFVLIGNRQTDRQG